MAIVYSVLRGQFSQIIECSEEIRAMCTSGSKDVLVVGTVLGSLYLYDLKNIDSGYGHSLHYNYGALLEQKVQGFNEMDEFKKQKKL
jgi:hypothetical protein